MYLLLLYCRSILILPTPIDGKTVETVSDLILGGPKSLEMVIAAMKFKDTPWKESYDQPAAAVAAKSLQARLTLCDPIGSTPPGSPSLDSILKTETLLCQQRSI